MSGGHEGASAESRDLLECRRVLRHGSRSFLAASLLLPRPVRSAATSLYAFCRLADDAVDEGGDDAALERLYKRLNRAFDGRPAATAVDRAFAATLRRHAIPRELPEALLEGFAWDRIGRRYDGLTDLLDYAVRVAGSVGVMMAMLMGCRNTVALARACDLGVAMQLTNIARDVGEDARAGRLYLPLDWLHGAGIDPGRWLAEPVFSDALGGVVQRLLVEADALYRRADAGIAMLPRSCRPAIGAARLLYAAIGTEIAHSGFDTVSRRAVVPGGRRTLLLGQALRFALAARRTVPVPALAEARFLIATVPPPSPLPAASSIRRPLWRRIDDRIAATVSLFERLALLDTERAKRPGFRS